MSKSRGICRNLSFLARFHCVRWFDAFTTRTTIAWRDQEWTEYKERRRQTKTTTIDSCEAILSLLQEYTSDLLLKKRLKWTARTSMFEISFDNHSCSKSEWKNRRILLQRDYEIKENGFSQNLSRNCRSILRCLLCWYSFQEPYSLVNESSLGNMLISSCVHVLSCLTSFMDTGSLVTKTVYSQEN